MKIMYELPTVDNNVIKTGWLYITKTLEVSNLRRKHTNKQTELPDLNFKNETNHMSRILHWETRRNIRQIATYEFEIAVRGNRSTMWVTTLVTFTYTCSHGGKQSLSVERVVTTAKSALTASVLRPLIKLHVQFSSSSQYGSAI